MQLSEFAPGLGTWIEAERYVGLGTQTYSRHASVSSASPRYRPSSDLPCFELETRMVPVPHAELVGVEDSVFHQIYFQDEHVVVPLHPDAVSLMEPKKRRRWDGWRPGPTFWVAPLANTRTVAVSSVGDQEVGHKHFLKLHFPGVLSRFPRPLYEEDVRHHLWVSGELLRSQAPVLAEVGGGLYRETDGSAWGYLLRDPYKIVRNGHTVVPMFSLYGTDVRFPSQKSLLEQLILQSGQSAGGYIAENIVEPLVRLWVEVALTTGCLLPLHGQNALFRFSRTSARGDVLFRDCSVYVDEFLRPSGTDLASTRYYRFLRPDDVSRAMEIRSLMYDSFLGHHVLEYIDRLAVATLGVSEGFLKTVAREAFENSGGWKIPMPTTVHYYDDLCSPQKGRWPVRDTGQRPSWRAALASL